MSHILVKNGSYRNLPVTDTRFKLVKGFHSGKKGNYITVINDGHFDVDIPHVKIKVDRIADIEFLTSDELPSEQSIAETDDEAMNRIAERFQILDEMSSACINGDIRSMIVSGPPGVGKSFGVEAQLEKATLFDRLSSKKLRYEIVKGAISGIGLFRVLYNYSDKKSLLVFDDCDVWQDPDALNVLKGALDSGKTRRISWNKDSRLLREEGIPNSFNFNGSVIFITNTDFDNVRSKMIKLHLEALQSRSHFLDLTINTARDQMLRIRQVHRDAPGGLFADHNITDIQSEEIMQFMWDNHTRLREISIRCALKIAALVKINPTNWQRLAIATICKPKSTR